LWRPCNVNAAVKGIGALAVDLPCHSGNKTVWRMDRCVTRVHQHKAARAVGGFQHTLFNTALTKQCCLLVVEHCANGRVNTKKSIVAGGAKKADFNFPMNQHLTWPVVGEILMNYSMDKTVLFKTLGQYRYNPALIIGATEGKEVLAAANGVCVRTEKTTELGNTMVFDLGDGYELTYGQLETITMKVGDVMKEGDIIGTVGTPSIYYAQEGANLYMKLTKDGVPVNPMNVLD